MAADLSTAAVLADEALTRAVRGGNPAAMATAHSFQLQVHYRGALAGVENHFAAGLKFFEDTQFRAHPGVGGCGPFGWSMHNAWILGRADVARERLAMLRAAARPANPHDLQWVDHMASALHAFMREYETAETLAARALDLCEMHRFADDAAYARCNLGYARAQLGGAADGIALIRRGIDAILQNRSRLAVGYWMTLLAVAQDSAGAVGDALETIEQALNFNPEEAVNRPEALRIRGELWLKQGDRQLAEADFRDSIAMARSMGAKAWELRTTMSLSRLLANQDRQ